MAESDETTISKDAFLKYLKDRKRLDSKFGSLIVETYKQKEEKQSQKKNEFKTKMETDAEFKAKVIAKRREYYAKHKEKMRLAAESDSNPESNPLVREAKPNPIRKEPKQVGSEAKSESDEDDVFTPQPTPQPIQGKRNNYVTRVNLF